MSQLKNQLNGRCGLPFVPISSSDSSSRSDVILVAVIVEKNYYYPITSITQVAKSWLGRFFVVVVETCVIPFKREQFWRTSLIIARGGHAARLLSRC
jgi:hypothetical protein